MTRKVTFNRVLVCTVLLGVVAPVFAVNDLSLVVAPGSGLVQPGDTVTVTLDVANLTAALNGVQSFIHFDPTLLSYTGVTVNTTVGGVGWTVGINQVNQGDLDFLATMNGGATAVNHSVATFTFTALAEGSTDLTFRPDQLPVATKLTTFDNSVIMPAKTDSGTGSIIIATAPRIAGVALFYPGHFADQADNSVNFLAPGSASNDLNVTSYINGVAGIRITFDRVVDFAGLNPLNALTFEWSTINGVDFVPVTPGAIPITASAINGATETTLTIILPDGLITHRWLRVTVKSDSVNNAGMLLDGELSGNPILLPTGDALPGGNTVFLVGSVPGDMDDDQITTLDDQSAIRLQIDTIFSVPINTPFDVDKSGFITNTDVSAVRQQVNPFIGLPVLAPAP